MAQSIKTIFDLGQGRNVADPAVAEAQAQQALGLQAQQMAQQQAARQSGLDMQQQELELRRMALEHGMGLDTARQALAESQFGESVRQFGERMGLDRENMERLAQSERDRLSFYGEDNEANRRAALERAIMGINAGREARLAEQGFARDQEARATALRQAERGEAREWDLADAQEAWNRAVRMAQFQTVAGQQAEGRAHQRAIDLQDRGFAREDDLIRAEIARQQAAERRQALLALLPQLGSVSAAEGREDAEAALSQILLQASAMDPTGEVGQGLARAGAQALPSEQALFPWLMGQLGGAMDDLPAGALADSRLGRLLAPIAGVADRARWLGPLGRVMGTREAISASERGRLSRAQDLLNQSMLFGIQE